RFSGFSPKKFELVQHFSDKFGKRDIQRVPDEIIDVASRPLANPQTIGEHCRTQPLNDRCQLFAGREFFVPPFPLPKFSGTFAELRDDAVHIPMFITEGTQIGFDLLMAHVSLLKSALETSSIGTIHKKRGQRSNKDVPASGVQVNRLISPGYTKFRIRKTERG